MKRIIGLCIVIILIGASFSALGVSNNKKEVIEPDSRPTPSLGGAYRYNIQGWVYVYIEGEPYDRGYQHGYLLADEITDMITRWSNIIHNFPMIKQVTRFVTNYRYDQISMTWWNFCKQQINESYWDKYPEEYKEEIIGIAAGVNAKGKKVYGSSITYQDILASNEMYEFLSKIMIIRKSIHPLRDLLHQLQEQIPDLAQVSEGRFFLEFLRLPQPHHCSGFIATGNATTEGQIVVTDSMWCGGGSWWWTLYIALRWNIILDINPIEGNRVIMASAPGFIWSDHDYYQNDAGIVLIETTLHQGLWDSKGLPLAVRARKALQYGESIDDVIATLREQNDGSMNAVWLIGDTKTGEIARFELGLYAYDVYRTFDGFYWSANNPMSLGVRLEKMKVVESVYYHLVHLLLNQSGYEYLSPRYRPGSRDLKYEELGNKYYGEIDVDVVKEIQSTRPIAGASTDVKLTDSFMLADNGLWAFMGKPTGNTIEYTNFNTKKRTSQIVDPNGWAEIYGVQPNKNYFVSFRSQTTQNNRDPVWTYDTNTSQNNFISMSTLYDDILYVTTTSDEVLALNPLDGTVLWNKSLEQPLVAPIILQDKLLVGSENLLVLYNRDTGELITEYPIHGVSDIDVTGYTVLVGTRDGDLFSLELINDSFVPNWDISLIVNERVFLSDIIDDYVLVTYGNNISKLMIDNHSFCWSKTFAGRITSEPVIFYENVYFGCWDAFVYALNVNNGSMSWQCEAGWGFDASPRVTDEFVFIGCMDQNLYKIDKETGQILWIFSGDAAIHSTPAVTDERIFFGCDDGRFYAADSHLLDLKWKFIPRHQLCCPKWNMRTTPIRSDPVLFEDMVIIGANGMLFAFDATVQSQSGS